jgi:hypothetical protein
MQALAIKKGSREKTTGFQEMGTLRCDGCGEEFFIGHDPAFVDEWLADREAHWLERALAEEHAARQETPRPNRIARLICMAETTGLSAW